MDGDGGIEECAMTEQDKDRLRDRWERKLAARRRATEKFKRRLREMEERLPEPRKGERYDDR